MISDSVETLLNQQEQYEIELAKLETKAKFNNIRLRAALGDKTILMQLDSNTLPSSPVTPVKTESVRQDLNPEHEFEYCESEGEQELKEDDNAEVGNKRDPLYDSDSEPPARRRRLRRLAPVDDDSEWEDVGAPVVPVTKKRLRASDFPDSSSASESDDENVDCMYRPILHSSVEQQYRIKYLEAKILNEWAANVHPVILKKCTLPSAMGMQEGRCNYCSHAYGKMRNITHIVKHLSECPGEIPSCLQDLVEYCHEHSEGLRASAGSVAFARHIDTTMELEVVPQGERSDLDLWDSDESEEAKTPPRKKRRRQSKPPRMHPGVVKGVEELRELFGGWKK